MGTIYEDTGGTLYSENDDLYQSGSPAFCCQQFLARVVLLAFEDIKTRAIDVEDKKSAFKFLTAMDPSSITWRKKICGLAGVDEDAVRAKGRMLKAEYKRMQKGLYGGRG